MTVLDTMRCVAGRLVNGDRIGDHVIVRFLAEGGNGEVYVARDVANERESAVKILSKFSPAAAVRFEREVNVLRALDHPGIVRLHAHGTVDGQPYFAMELLAGETLEQRLARGPMDVRSAVGTAIEIASALAHAHARGVVHRDLKPGNVFLRSGDAPHVKVLDFGIARRMDDRKITGTGTVIGTPAYMAPEQARGENTIDARADLFALGCVLYEAVSGQQAFASEQFVAVLAKILLDEPTPLRDVVPGIAPALDELVTRMLAKDPAARPSDATVVVDALRAIDLDASAGVPARVASRPTAITTGEQRLVSAILVAPPGDGSQLAAVAATHTGEDDETIRKIARLHGASLATLADGTLLLALSGRGNVADQATTAAACALAIAGVVDGARVALATGRAETTGPWPVGPVIERAAAVLARGLHTGEIGVDELTARLLETRYEIARGVLRGARMDGTALRTLLGKPTPCVGREKELALLDATLAESIDEPAARAVMIVAPSGVGKSRVLHEFVERVRARNDATVLSARTDPVSPGSALAIARQLVLSAVHANGADSGETLEGIRRRASSLGIADAARVCEFLAAIVGITLPAEATPQLSSARNDARLMGEWLRRSFLDWLAAEVSARPLLIVIEDLHWGDAPSVGYLDDALRAHARAPFMVIATARPEVATVFPDAWSAPNAQLVRLGGLPRRAAERLARSVLGETRSAGEVARLIDRADGNAFYLEELVRSVAERGSTELPETVLAMAQARLDALEPEARRILRAASVFGERFWARGVEALLGGERAGEWLATLARREVIVRSDASRFADETEYAFRHGLIREVAYATLPGDDARLAHRLAGEWLDGAGERDAQILAEHFERGGATERAVSALVLASRAAYEGGDVRLARALADRGIAAGATGKPFGFLQHVRAGVASLSAEWTEALAAARHALASLDPDEPAWWDAGSIMLFVASTLGDMATGFEAVQTLLGAPDPSVFNGQYARAMGWIMFGLTRVNQWDLIGAVLARVEATAARLPAHDPSAAGWLLGCRLIPVLRQHSWPVLQQGLLAQNLFEVVGDVQGLAMLGMGLGLSWASLGMYDDAERALLELKESAHRAGLIFHERVGLVWHDVVRVIRSETGDEPSWFDTGESIGDVLEDALRGAILALRALRRGELDVAERLARPVLESAAPIGGWFARFVLARVALLRGRPAEALAALDHPNPGEPSTGFDRAEVELARIETYLALGDEAGARDAARVARERILAYANGIGDPRVREGYLTNIRAHPQILALAAKLLDDAAPS